MTKLLWHSNSPFAPTGYGGQTALFAPRVAEHYEVGISCFYGLEGAPLWWKDIPLFPGTGADFGNRVMLQHAKHFFDGDITDGIVFTLMDVWPLSTDMMRKLKAACWVPVDHEPCIPLVLEFFQRSGAVPIAMSRFGQEQLQSHGLDALYVPHGVDTKVYKPRDKDRVRKAGNVPKDAFFVGMVAANKGNPSRKGFVQALQAFAIFREKHDDALLYLHTVTDPNVASGEDLMAIIESLGLDDAVRVAPSYRLMYNPFSPDDMAQMYSAFDVLLNPSMGEGFGIPIIEAAACGVPAIVTNFTAMPEVAGKAGWAVGCRKYWTPGCSWQGVADVEEIVAALEQAYGESEGQRKQRSRVARLHALNYDADKIMSDHFLPTLQEVEERVGSSISVETVASNGQPAQKLAVEK